MHELMPLSWIELNDAYRRKQMTKRETMKRHLLKFNYFYLI